MNIKKILAGIAASALAVSTLAITASAADFKNEYTYKNSAANLNADTSGEGFFTQVQLGHIQKIDSLTISYETSDGSTGYALIQTNWGGDEAVEANALKWDGGSFENWTGANVFLPEGVAVEDTVLTFTAVTDVNSEWATYIEKHPEAADFEVPDMMIITIGNDTSSTKGVILAEYESSEPVDAAETTAEDSSESAEAPAASAGNDAAVTADKNNADTGVEGVAMVAGLAIIAVGAVVVAKKRK